jgi:hypothetical protein
MTNDEKEDLFLDIYTEGFDDCFDGYSDFEEIKDPEFHRLRLEYLKAKTNLAKYIEI